MYAIREIDADDSDSFLFAPKMHQIAQEQKLWKPADGPLDFAEVFSSGEYGHKYYSGRRMWGSFHLLAPSAGLSPHYGNLKTDKPHPVSAQLPLRLLVRRLKKSCCPVSLQRQAGSAAGGGRPLCGAPFQLREHKLLGRRRPRRRCLRPTQPVWGWFLREWHGCRWQLGADDLDLPQHVQLGGAGAGLAAGCRGRDCMVGPARRPRHLL